MKKTWLLLLALVALLVAFVLYTGDYYRAGPTALAALESDIGVQVTETDWGWLFDGPAEDRALIFYPGAKVDTAAYAPLLHTLAAGGMDALLVDMPFHLAFFGMDRASGLMQAYDYAQWYVGGHSLGGAMAADYAARHGDALAGLVLCAAYPSKALPDGILEVSLYGTEDRVLNRDRLEKGRDYAPERLAELAIEGGNHAQFGDYGVQKGDGAARIDAQSQRQIAVDFILQSAAGE